MMLEAAVAVFSLQDVLQLAFEHLGVGPRPKVNKMSADEQTFVLKRDPRVGTGLSEVRAER